MVDYSQRKLSPDQALQKLQEGNNRFVHDQRTYPNLNSDWLKIVSKGQNPFATVLTCSDSRVSPEHLFDAGLGDIFTICVAGNVCGPHEIASIEIGVDIMTTPVVVVLGHTQCGAVTIACNQKPLNNNIPDLIKKIQPAVEKTNQEFPQLSHPDKIEKTVITNIWQSIKDIFSQSALIKARVLQNEVKIIGALYHLENGIVEWLGEYPDQNSLI
jgi:carbonic anhydrase